MRKIIFFLFIILSLNILGSTLFAKKKIAFAVEYSKGVEDKLYGVRWFYSGDIFGFYAGIKLNWSFEEGDDYYDNISPNKAENVYGDEYLGSDFIQYELTIGGSFNLSVLPVLKEIEPFICLNILAGISLYSNREVRNYRDNTYILADDGTYSTEGYIDESKFGVEFGAQAILFEALSLHLTYSTATKTYSYGAGFALCF